MQDIRLMIVEDHSLELEGMLRHMESAQHIKVVKSTQDGNKAYQYVYDTQPNVILMDIVLKDSEKNGLELTAEILKHFPKVRILIFSNHSDVAFLLKAMEVGASGYLMKTCTREELRLAIDAVACGMLIFDSQMTSSMRGVISGRTRVLHWGILTDLGLTKRQIEITRCWYEAHDNNGSADPVAVAKNKLGLSTIDNVQNRLSEVCSILSVHRAELYDTITDKISCIS